MKTFSCLILCVLLLSIGDGVMQTAAAQDQVISLTVSNQPLGQVLETLADSSGVQFTLNEQWKNHLVSAAIENQTLEHVLKRLLRNLNHTVIWESDRTVAIMIYSKAAGAGSVPATSFAAPDLTDHQEIPLSDDTPMVMPGQLDPSLQLAEDGAVVAIDPDGGGDETIDNGTPAPPTDPHQPFDASSPQ